ncbi:MAG TPA: serine--tRNA ligase [bacterium]|nr:serine--tRNA ligase [bacterium]
MIDLKLLRDQPDLFRASMQKRGLDPSVIDEVLALDRRRREILARVEGLRAGQKRASDEIRRLTGSERTARLEEMKQLAAEIKAEEPGLNGAELALTAALRTIPNPPHPSVPEGGADAGQTIRTVGAPPTFPFAPRDHVELGALLDILDVERSARTSGSRFFFLRREGALLQLALVRYGVDQLSAEGFVPTITPVLVRRENLLGMMGGAQLDDQMVYRVEGEDLALTGTSEMALGTMYAGEVLEEAQLPVRLCGISTCFRREAGAHGKDTRGIFRVHQFDKVEMFSYCHPDRSWDEQEFLLSLEERLWQSLGLPYRVVNIAAGDLGDPAARKFDIETWMPGRNGYGETQSCSNCTDFQARGVNVRFRRRDRNGTEFVHTLNGTAVAVPRTIVAILENYQQADGSVRIPEPLVPYMGGLTQIRPRETTAR